jgi:hypothetical protein
VFEVDLLPGYLDADEPDDITGMSTLTIARSEIPSYVVISMTVF